MTIVLNPSFSRPRPRSAAPQGEIGRLPVEIAVSFASRRFRAFAGRRAALRLSVDLASAVTARFASARLYGYRAGNLEVEIDGRRREGFALIGDGPGPEGPLADIWSETPLEEGCRAVRLTAARVCDGMETLVLGESIDERIGLGATLDIEDPEGDLLTLNGEQAVRPLRRAARPATTFLS